MDDEHSHPLLAQVPLTVSPFVSLPTATTLPYTYKSLPASLPRSAVHQPQGAGGEAPTKSKFVVSSSGQAAHPDDILASCRALQAHLTKIQDDAKASLAKWERNIKERELAEKRRVAPGWLDSDDKLLQPLKAASTAAAAAAAEAPAAQTQPSLLDDDKQATGSEDDQQGQELDRAFGSMSMQTSKNNSGTAG